MPQLAEVAHTPIRKPLPQLTFAEWKGTLYECSEIEGTLPIVRTIPDRHLFLFYAEGCHPSLTRILQYSDGSTKEAA